MRPVLGGLRPRPCSQSGGHARQRLQHHAGRRTAFLRLHAPGAPRAVDRFAHPWNFVQCSFFGYAVSGMTELRTSLIATEQTGPEIWTGGAFGPEGGLV